MFILAPVILDVRYNPTTRDRFKISDSNSQKGHNGSKKNTVLVTVFQATNHCLPRDSIKTLWGVLTTLF